MTMPAQKLWKCPDCQQTVLLANWKQHWYDGYHAETEADLTLVKKIMSEC